MTGELRDIIGGLRVHPEAMRRNLEAGGGRVFSQGVLLALTGAGLARDDAYAIVQEHALASLERGVSFRDGLEGDPRVTRVLARESLARCFELDPALRHVDALFARAGTPAP
jgi:adenylosuccinate lyase